MKMQANYKLSFTAGGLMFNETLKILELYQSNRSWDEIKNIAIYDNIFQSRVKSSLIRKVGELFNRIKNLNDKEIDFFLASDQKIQKYILWISVCRTYKFISQFTEQVLQEKVLHVNSKVTYEDFDAFYGKISDWQPELEEIKDSTKKKIRQVLFKMMKEAEILSESNEINFIFFPKDFTRVFNKIEDSICYLPIVNFK